jgi:anti-anti-sigma factor
MSTHQQSEDPTATIPSGAFRVSETALEPDCREIRVEGELDLAVADQLRERLEAAVEQGVEVLVSLDRCDFIDSTGIAVIVLARQQLARKGRRLAICDPSDRVARILGITGLDLAGVLYPSVEAAMAERPAKSIDRPEDREIPVVAEISREIVRLHSRLYGRGPTKARTMWRDDVVTCVLEDVFTKAETVLVDAGRFEQVRSNRQVFNDEVASQLREIVEAATGRPVKSSLSQIGPGGVAAEVFLLS